MSHGSAEQSWCRGQRAGGGVSHCSAPDCCLPGEGWLAVPSRRPMGALDKSLTPTPVWGISDPLQRQPAVLSPENLRPSLPGDLGAVWGHSWWLRWGRGEAGVLLDVVRAQEGPTTQMTGSEINPSEATTSCFWWGPPAPRDRKGHRWPGLSITARPSLCGVRLRPAFLTRTWLAVRSVFTAPPHLSHVTCCFSVTF